ncbi:3'-5' exonuclease [Psychrobacter sp. I-STPA10]|uniref:3'-5' exonuclease n=1 Tax=Psychrobacter sp. I-STPA10 TaxID=2585769 RepID=UPI001E3A71B2|nr:3'-5' exonuclease [Psychrobacter sp. I-STPA10]
MNHSFLTLPEQILIFDIETIPDLDTGKRLYPQLAALSDTDALTALTAMRQQEANTTFMRLPLHKIACLSMLWVDSKQQRFRLKSFALNDYQEAEIINTFFNIFASDKKVEKLPNIVSWNGNGFDIPVIQYRAMHHKLTAPAFFNDKFHNDYKYNNYVNRYHTRHIDLMDRLSMFGASTRQQLDVIASLCGLAGKQDIDGSMVVDLVQNQDWHTLTTYCESDVINTWLLYLRWQLLQGNLTLDSHSQWQMLTQHYLQSITNSDGSLTHQGFLDSWQM